MDEWPNAGQRMIICAAHDPSTNHECGMLVEVSRSSEHITNILLIMGVVEKWASKSAKTPGL